MAVFFEDPEEARNRIKKPTILIAAIAVVVFAVAGFFLSKVDETEKEYFGSISHFNRVEAVTVYNGDTYRLQLERNRDIVSARALIANAKLPGTKEERPYDKSMKLFFFAPDDDGVEQRFRAELFKDDDARRVEVLFFGSETADAASILDLNNDFLKLHTMIVEADGQTGK